MQSPFARNRFEFRFIWFVFSLIIIGLWSDVASCQTTAELHGTVYFHGDVMPQFTVSLYSKDRVLQTETDKSGRFEFKDLSPGTYDLQARDL
jgi:hypothetical protein